MDSIGLATLYCVDCLEWFRSQPDHSIHAVVTDPPYGFQEYTDVEIQKMRDGSGGVWRQPPKLGGSSRAPLPRFTVLSDKDTQAMTDFFLRWSREAFRVLVPGAHVFVASNPLTSHLVYAPLMSAGFEKRGEIIRLVQTLRGGDRPKNAHEEFLDVSVMPRSAWEPWGLFRKPCEGTVAENLRRWGTGGLRRESDARPFTDVLRSAPTQGVERKLSNHPSLKPQAFMRQIVRASLPLGTGVVLDPFMGGGSTIAAAENLGYRSIGLERDPTYYQTALQGIPKLANV